MSAKLEVSVFVKKPGLDEFVLFSKDVDEHATFKTAKVVFDVAYKLYVQTFGFENVEIDGNAFEAIDKDGRKILIEVTE